MNKMHQSQRPLASRNRPFTRASKTAAASDMGTLRLETTPNVRVIEGLWIGKAATPGEAAALIGSCGAMVKAKSRPPSIQAERLDLKK